MHQLSNPSVTRVNGVDYDREWISLQNVEHGRSEQPITIPNLSTCVANLRVEVEKCLSKEGNCHWGNYCDINALSNALNVGFIVFKNESYHGVTNLCGWVYSLASSRGDYSHWMMLYCKNETHFQLAALNHGRKINQAVFAIHEVPQAIKEVYNVNNTDAHMGAERSSGFS